jgi:Fe-S cluster biogenesis protein NfuA
MMDQERNLNTERKLDYHPGDDPELRKKVEDALDMIRPYLMADGGSVRVQDITPDMVVELELLGACGSCPMSTMTLRAGIEQALKRSVPQISRVEAVNAPSAY